MLKGAQLIGCAWLPPRSWIITFKGPSDAQINLLLCFQHPFQRFHLISRRFAHKTDPFSEKTLSTLKEFKLTGCRLLNQDRILELQFQKKSDHYALIGEFFSKCPNFYLIDDQKRIIASIYPASKTEYSLPNRSPRSSSRQAGLLEKTTHSSVENHYYLLEKEWELKEEKQRIEKMLSRQLKHAQKRREECARRLQECSLWPRKMHEAAMLQANIYRLKKGMDEVTVSDWEDDGKEVRIALDPLLLPHEEIAKRFKSSKKLKAGEEHARRRLEMAERDEQSARALKETLSALNSAKELEKFAAEHPALLKKSPGQLDRQKSGSAKPYREFYTAAGLSVWVGKNARDNDKLTFSVARGGDWWFHARDYSGSHVVLRPLKNREPDQESIQDAIHLALFFSKARDKGEGEVCLTQRKYVSRLGKDKAGKVAISKHKAAYIRLDLERIRQIQERMGLLK